METWIKIIGLIGALLVITSNFVTTETIKIFKIKNAKVIALFRDSLGTIGFSIWLVSSLLMHDSILILITGAGFFLCLTRLIFKIRSLRTRK